MTPATPEPTSAAPPANWQELVQAWEMERQTWEQHRQAWQNERASLLQIIAQQQQQIDQLLTQVKYLNRQLHGQKNERFTPVKPGELLLPGFHAGALAAAADLTATPPPPSPSPPPKPAGAAAARKQPPGRPQFIFPPDCPVIQREILPAAVIAAPDAYRKIRESQTELLHITPAQFSKLIITRPVFVPVIKDLTEPSASAPLIAPLPTLQEDSHVSPSTLAYIVTSKYADHLPYYRQEQIYKTRHGIYLPRQTMCRWARMAHEIWLPGILSDLKTAILRSKFLHIDETPIKYLSPGNGQTKQGYLWVIHAPGIGTYYHWSTSRGAKVLEELLPEDWSGHIICDGYAVYDKLRKDRPQNITLCACLAHVRRKFYEAQAHAPAATHFILRQIQLLYDIEARLKAERASPRQIKRRREVESQPIYHRLKKLLDRYASKRTHLPQSKMGQAIHYALGQWADLLPVLQHGHLPIDNNPVEREIRPTAIGKKNYLFFGPGESGQVSAGYYSLIATAKHHGLDPFKYLEDLFEALPSLVTPQQSAWLPAAYAQARPSQPLRYTETRPVTHRATPAQAA